MNNLTLVPKDSTALDVLAARYRAAFAKMEGGREQWIEGTLELAVVVADARGRFRDHRAFGDWLKTNGLALLSPMDRSALVGFSRDLVAARKMLESSSLKTWRGVWEKQPKRTPIESDKGPPSRTSGYAKRQRRAARVPSPPPPPRPAVNLKGPTREEIDPDFEGTDLEWRTKYGHVNLQTKGEIEHNKRQQALSTCLGAIAAFEQSGRAAVAALAAVDPATLREWLSKPAKAAKLRAWCESVQKSNEKLLGTVEPV
jgi:hypothetical protein